MSDASDRDELQATAGEYVLGTLNEAERRQAAARLATDRAFADAVALWAQRLQPLADGAGTAAPNPDLFHRIAARTTAAGNAAATNVALERSVSRWRVSTAFASMVAIAAIVVAIGDRMVPSVAPHEFVAVLSMGGATPAFVATVNLDAQTLVIRRVADAAPADKDYQLWAIPPGGMPQSLGVVTQARFNADLGDIDLADLTLAVSLEPKGGSKTGAPTGPVEFTGKLIPGT